jgi:TolB-like protein
MHDRRAARIAIAIAILALAFGPRLGAADEELPGLAVMFFADETANEWWAFNGANRARDLFIAELDASGRFRVLARDALDPRLQELKLTTLAGEISRAAAVKAGRQLGVRYLVTARLTEFGTAGRRLLGLRAGRSFAAELDARLIDAESAAVIWADGGRTEATVDRPPKRAEIAEAAYYERMFDRVLGPIVAELARSLALAEIGADLEGNRGRER